MDFTSFSVRVWKQQLEIIVKAAKKLGARKTWLTHGEPAAAQSLQAAIREKFHWDVAAARYLDTVEVG